MAAPVPQVYPSKLQSKPMSDENSLKGRVTRQGEEAIGRFAQELLENPMVAGALSRAFETRERAMRAQEVAMGALNLPSASDLERLTRRVRSVSQRLEGIEDALDRLDERLGRSDGSRGLDERLARIEASLERLEKATAQTRAPARAKRPAAKSTPATPKA
jgi:hypothetical protein